ncbi:SAM-dependent methyltransferase [Bradyrhizobium sp. BWA-3-5]|uniref:class I SAM-dependent methyltransferase n=1 Tax=Bradyrhizobium sp. BWA-3-5 TaxID=3080013 RepID=UPI00293E804F|nr:SAM-dependent methyltransferase [Bradyrhizobium sp. BWA-3-5]WOH67436.1 SAM-dependent methyltransferase [Bradyrhizobium sp. BWA-3-5]
MLQHQPSRTAEYMAMFRASEHAKGAGQRVFADPLAIALLPGNLRLSARLLAIRPVGGMLARYIDRQWPGARTSGIARTRLIDDWIAESIGPAEQIVLLGAGFDTRAWRLGALATVKVFEVDHPATAKVKRQRLQAAGADLDRVTFVAVDFEIDDFEQRLRDAGFDPARRSIVVWEGVSQYLTGEAVCGVMRWAGRLAPGSRFIFTYVHEGAIDGSVAFDGADKVIAKVGVSGEPWRFGLLPSELPAFLRERGLRLVSDLGADQYRERVIGQAGCHMHGYSFYHTVLAEVGDA